MLEKFIKSFDGKEIHCYFWDQVVNPKGIVQIFHGMAEHAKRYDEFAQYLNKQGYLVFADDHRAHGFTTAETKLGKYDGYDVFFDTLKDEIFFSKYLKEKYKLPLYVFGHSYGSFIAQEYLTMSQEHQKAILCGSAFMKKRIDIKCLMVILFILKTFRGNKPAKFIEKIMYKQYNKAVGTGSWLNTDPKEVENYYSDKFNGYPLSYKFYFNMFNSFRHSYSKKRVSQIDKDKPILLLCGENDPVGSMSKSVKQLHNFYLKNNIKNVELKIYANARHEILNEPDTKQKVFDDIVEFLNK